MADHTESRNEIETAFETHPAYELDGTALVLSTTPFDARVTIQDGRTPPDDGSIADDAHDEPPNPDMETRYRVRIRVPTLDAAAEDRVADVVADGWFETFSLRLADAPDVTRSDVNPTEPTVRTVGTEIVVTFEFAHASPERAATVAKTLSEYVEGTYVQGVVPGYTYESPVADLLSRARRQGTGESSSDGDGSDGDDTGSPMPL